VVLLLETHEWVFFAPVSYSRFLWDISLGVWTPYERAKEEFGEVRVWSPRFEQDVWKALARKGYASKDDDFFLVLNPQYVYPVGFQFERGLGITPEGKWVYLCGENLTEDVRRALEGQNVNWLAHQFSTREVSTGIYYRDVADLVNRQESVLHFYEPYFEHHNDFVSLQKGVYVHRSATIDPYVVWHAENGMIVVDCETKVRAFSIVDGPTYIGKQSLVDSGRIREATTIRDHCKIGGEVEWSIVESYSNKHHEGFLGHSYVGSWVNIGAMATTSDLKNNYRPVVIRRREGEVDTRTNKFGSVISDFVKIGIGIMLNTGTVIEPGCNIFIEDGSVQVEKYMPAFSWGRKGRYEWEKFYRDLTTMMRRRNYKPPQGYEAFLRGLYGYLISSEEV